MHFTREAYWRFCSHWLGINPLKRTIGTRVPLVVPWYRLHFAQKWTPGTSPGTPWQEPGGSGPKIQLIKREHSSREFSQMSNSGYSSELSDTEAKIPEPDSSFISTEISEGELKKYIENVNPLYKKDILFPDSKKLESC
ncbi:uncharacterized protein PGTG_15975 [Puccinia graminis f. sp. tritici CRL 75-36-700-3]|uniref:Uncharacterized protein n=1 Tax=Puccinia graminis f. sp. tritici (strain CRL 75-36-700-3 / race SCCL) TaxID=418459 RepID=E3L0S3_PUCGT|nr:uncharacterized protein PGTG_15975 [Puccinia graminis f. sp. tritici CRL 75-36-700-3]EFP90127.1 hypothetical protein PGTG_15975 [Puccinia graminis f. sp. tritici CRL 75-36-700-3]